MKMLYRLSLATLLLSTTLAKADIIDYWQAKHEEDTQALALETETVMLKIKKQIADYNASRPKPKTWYSKENGKNVLTRIKNGTIAATLSYGLFTALTKYASHLPFETIPASTGLLIPFLIGSFEKPKDRYSALTSATLGLSFTTTAALPTRTNMIILGSLIALWSGSAIYENIKKPTTLRVKEETIKK